MGKVRCILQIVAILTGRKTNDLSLFRKYKPHLQIHSLVWAPVPKVCLTHCYLWHTLYHSWWSLHHNLLHCEEHDNFSSLLRNHPDIYSGSCCKWLLFRLLRTSSSCPVLSRPIIKDHQFFILIKRGGQLCENSLRATITQLSFKYLSNNLFGSSTFCSSRIK